MPLLASTATIAVTCRPFCPGPTCTLSLVPGSTASCPAACNTATCKNTSPEPSASSTKPKPLSALNHLTMASTDGPLGAPFSRRPDRNGCCELLSRVAGGESQSSSNPRRLGPRSRPLRICLFFLAPNDLEWCAYCTATRFYLAVPPR